MHPPTPLIPANCLRVNIRAGISVPDLIDITKTEGPCSYCLQANNGQGCAGERGAPLYSVILGRRPEYPSGGLRYIIEFMTRCRMDHWVKPNDDEGG